MEGRSFGYVPLSLEQWAKIIVVSASVLIVGFVLRVSYRYECRENREHDSGDVRDPENVFQGLLSLLTCFFKRNLLEAGECLSWSNNFEFQSQDRDFCSCLFSRKLECMRITRSGPLRGTAGQRSFFQIFFVNSPIIVVDPRRGASLLVRQRSSFFRQATDVRKREAHQFPIAFRTAHADSRKLSGTNGRKGQSEKMSGFQNIFFFHINSPIATEMITEKPKMVSKASGLSDKGRSRTFMP